MKRLFIIDDDEDILFSLKHWFAKRGFSVEIFSLPEPMLDALESRMPGLILMDVNLGTKDGREICRELKEQNHLQCPILLFSANPFNLENYQKYLADGAVEKPFSLNEITDVITRLTQTG